MRKPLQETDPSQNSIRSLEEPCLTSELEIDTLAAPEEPALDHPTEYWECQNKGHGIYDQYVDKDWIPVCLQKSCQWKDRAMQPSEDIGRRTLVCWSHLEVF